MSWYKRIIIGSNVQCGDISGKKMAFEGDSSPLPGKETRLGGGGTEGVGGMAPYSILSWDKCTQAKQASRGGSVNQLGRVTNVPLAYRMRCQIFD